MVSCNVRMTTNALLLCKVPKKNRDKRGFFSELRKTAVSGCSSVCPKRCSINLVYKIYHCIFYSDGLFLLFR